MVDQTLKMLLPYIRNSLSLSDIPIGSVGNNLTIEFIVLKNTIVY